MYTFIPWIMIIIQKATATEAVLIADIGARSFLESHGNSAPAADVESYVSGKYNLKAVEEELNNHENIFHIIYYETQAVGFSQIIFNKPHTLIESTGITKLEKLYLLKEFHDLKLGLTLFEFTVSLSKEENQNGIWLFVWTRNQRAITFYKKNGFKIIGNTDFKISETHSNPNHVMYLKY
jgi:diamine N-acetyltransferase